ncbi:MAG: restriction endonuclease subunit S [Thiobacillus sp.]
MTLDVYKKYELPAGWEWKKLGEICNVSDRDHRTPIYVDDGVPLISPRDFTEHGIDLSRLKKVAPSELVAFEKKCKPQKGDILYSRIGTIGEARLHNLDFDFVALHSIALVKPIEPGLDSKYVLYLLQTQAVRSQAKHNIKSVGTPDLGLKRIKEFDVPLAPPDQQERIVAEIEKQFSRLDEAVANLKRVKANLKRYKAAVLKAAVEGRLVVTEAERARREGRSYETGAQLLQRILETRRSQWQGKSKCKEPVAPDTSDLPELPEGWVWATYAQIGEVTTGFTPPTAEPENFGGDIPFFKPTDLDAGESVVLAREHLSEKGAAKGRLLPAGSVLVTCIGATIGKTGLARVSCATNQQINAVTPDGNLVNSEFVYAWTVSPSGYKQILDNSSATTLPILNKSKFEALGIPLPPLVDQHRIVAEVDRRLSLLRETEAQVDVNLQRADRMRQAILARAFSGVLINGNRIHSENTAQAAGAA